MTTPRRVCGRTRNAASCDSAIFPTHGIEYSHVCGRVIGYQNLSPDSFDTFRGILPLPLLTGTILMVSVSHMEILVLGSISGPLLLDMGARPLVLIALAI